MAAVAPVSAHAATYSLDATARSSYTVDLGRRGTPTANFVTGDAGELNFRGYLVFDLSKVQGAISSASLSFDTTSAATSSTNNAQITVFDYVGSINQLKIGGGNAVASIFADLGSGTTYGSFSAPSQGQVSVSLNKEALTALTGSIGSQFAVGLVADSGFAFGGSQIGTVTRLSLETMDVAAAVPEPATWAMMLVGFGGIGFAMRRRSKVRARVAYAA